MARRNSRHTDVPALFKDEVAKAGAQKVEWSHFANISTGVQEAKYALEEIQNDLQWSVSEELMQKETSVSKEYIWLRRDEESFLRPKSRTNWLNLGDQNSTFFFHAVKKFQSKSKIGSVSLDDGTSVTEPSRFRTLWLISI